MSLYSRLPHLAAVLLLCLSACTAQPTGSAPPTEAVQPSGSVQFAAYVPQALTASDVNRIKVTVSAADMPSLSVDLAKTNGTWGGVIGNIPAGSNRIFLAEAFDASGTQRFQGSTSNVSITANQTTAVAITLQELVPPQAYSNEAPLIDSLVASITTVQPGGTVSLSATVRDPNAGDTLTSSWTATAGSFSTPAATSTSWTAPSTPGIQTLTFTVTDSQGAAGAVSLAINVISGTSTGSASASVSFNLFPVVSKVSASRTRIDAGQSTSVSANAADADADALSYQWSAVGCTGTWTNATSSSASFVPSTVPSGACNNCRLTVTVQDVRGGQGTGSINLCVAAASIERFAPLFTNTYQSTTATSPGQSATVSVTAMDPQASAVTFTWMANTGSLAPAQSTASTSQVVWSAPACAVTGTPASVTAFATNAYGVWASKTLSFSGLPACASGWSTVGSLATGRHNLTATLLFSGKVLVVGGYGSSGHAVSAEVYDPASNLWSSAGTLATARRNHTATLLNSGKVLVVGGTSDSSSSVEVYDPATNSWSSAAPLGANRYLHTATFLPSSGKVLVTGGHSSSGYVASAELYDPAANSWSSAGSLVTARYYHTATLLNSGKVLIAGGHDGTFLSSVEVYNPATNSWSSAAPLGTARYFHTATLLGSGKVLVAAGNNGNSLASVEVYDPATNSWSSPPGSLSTARYAHAMALLSSGRVLITGGYNAESTVNVFATELYTP